MKKNLFNINNFVGIFFITAALSLSAPILFTSIIKKADASVPCGQLITLNSKKEGGSQTASALGSINNGQLAELDPPPCSGTPSGAPPDPPNQNVTIRMWAVTCNYESNLPDWSYQGTIIYSTTAQDYVNNSGGKCKLDSGWTFSRQRSDLSYTTIGTTNSAGYVSEQVPYDTYNIPYVEDTPGTGHQERRIYTKETEKSGYYTFSNDRYPPSVSAELRCWTDNKVYDNYDYIGQGPDYLNTPISPGGSYDCIAFNAYLTPPSATINVSANCPVQSWTINGGYGGSGTSGSYTVYPNGGTTYTISPVMQPNYVLDYVNNSDGGGSSMYVSDGNTKGFNIGCHYVAPTPCMVKNFDYQPRTVAYGGSTVLSFSSNDTYATGICDSGKLEGGPWPPGYALASNGYSGTGNTADTGALYSNTTFVYTVCKGTQCDAQSFTVPVGSPNACYPSPNPSNYGNACNSGTNACGSYNTGTIQCNGACSASTPSNPAGYGNACNSGTNACGSYNTGTIQCNGSCSASTPLNPAGYGNVCYSAANSCGQQNQGTIQCNGSCSATTPSNSSCSFSVSLSANWTSMTLPTNYVRLTWTTVGSPTSCDASNYWSGAKDPAGNFEDRTGMTAGTYTYTITCHKSGFSDVSSTVNVVVNPAPAISVSLSASPTSMTLPTSSTRLTWTTIGNPDSCTASNYWSGAKSPAGSWEDRTGMTSGTYTYTITCSKAGTSDVSSTVNVVVNPASAISVSLSASPTSMILPTNSTRLTWTTTGSPDSCSASNYWSGAKAANGGFEDRTGMTQGTYTYTITCSKAGAADTSSTVNVVVNPASSMIGTLTPASPSCVIALGQSSCSINFTWETHNAIGTSAITKPVNQTVATGNFGTNVPFSVKHNSETFYLYNSGIELANSSVTSSCISGTSWDSTSGTCTASGSACNAVSNDGSGGTISNITVAGVNYRVHTFTSSGTFIPPTSGVSSVDYLVVGGGGGGGGGEIYPGNGDAGGGGGGGGFRTGTISVSQQSYPVTVGAGGNGGAGNGYGGAGGNSSFSTITAVGGGRGAAQEQNGGSGGSGGGAGGSCSGPRSGGAGTAGQGNNGGLNDVSACEDKRSGAGGGGAGSAGGNVNTSYPGNGGGGLSSSITGTANTFAGGGGGGKGDGYTTGAGGTGGTGGGGAGGSANYDVGNPGANGIPNTGGGGGGGARGNPAGTGGVGGTGIVIIRYSMSPGIQMCGTLTPATASCLISAGQNSCNINFSWSTINPVATSVVTKPTNITVGSGNNGTNVPFAVKYNSENFYLYNNGVQLDQKTVTSDCSAGTTWGGTICQGFDYSLANSGTTVVTKGGINQSGQNIISETLVSGATQPVTLSLSGAPAGVTSSFSTCASPNCTSTITFTVPPSTPAGTYPITVTGSPLNKTTTFTLDIRNSPSVVVSCSKNPSPAVVGQTVTWSASASGGSGTGYTYSWSGTNIPTAPAPTTNPYTITYGTVGTKTARVLVTDSLSNTGTCPDSTVLINLNPKFEEI